MTTRGRAPGFALIAALVLAVATATVAVGLVVVAGGTRAAVTHTVQGEAAESIARAGLQRAEAYALEASTKKPDFDLVLDPGREADCSAVQRTLDAGMVPERGDMYLPRLTDAGARVVEHAGKRWRLVPYADGAFLVRFEDNQDDTINATSSPDWSLSTSNTRAGLPLDPTYCVEGPTLPTDTPPGSSGVENPARDRDRAIWITVVGIAPGQDPAAARHRAVLRKLLVDTRTFGPPGVRVGGDITTSSGGAMQLCSDESGVAAIGEIDTGSPGSCSCGTTSGTDVKLTGGDGGSCGSCCTNENPYEESTDEIVPPPNVPNHAASKWYDWASVCNFYMDRNGLYFWDAAARRGSLSTCGAYAGNLVPPSTNSDDQGSCWTPIFLVSTTALRDVPIEGLDAAAAPPSPEVFSCGADCVEWRPRRETVGYDLGAAPGGQYYTTGSRSSTGVKPDWSICPNTPATDFRWSPPSEDPGAGSEAVGCTTCDGGNAVLRWRATAPRWRFESGAAALTAYPVGVYVHQGPLTWANTGGSFPTTQSPSTNWPMITLVVNGDVTTPSGSRMFVGVGTKKNAFPSLIAQGSLTVQSGSRFTTAGSIYLTGDMLIESGGSNGAYLFGMVQANGDLSVESGGRLYWDYDSDLLEAGTKPPPTPRLVVPLSY